MESETRNFSRVYEPISKRAIIFNYSEKGLLTQAVTSGGRSVTLDYTEDHLTDITYPNGTIESFSYNGFGLMEEHRIDTVLISKTFYDDFSRVVEQEDAKSNNEKVKAHYTETDEAITTTFTNKLGIQKTETYNPYYQLIYQKNENGDERTLQYNEDGKPTKINGSNGKTTTMAYNQYGDVTQITTAGGSTETRQYDSKRNLLKVTNAYGKYKTFTYDVNNNQLTATDELGNTTYYSYNSNNQLISETTPEGRTTQYSYIAGELRHITNPKGNIRYLEYDTDGRLIATSDYQNNYTRYTLDELGRKLSATDPLEQRQTWTYNARGQVLVYTDAKGTETRHEYNAQGDRVKTKKIDNTVETVWQSTYDGESRLIKRIDPNGNTTRYERDALGRITKTTNALGHIVEHHYDANDNVTKQIDPLKQHTTSSYDAMNRVTQRQDTLGHTSQFSYDALGRLHGVTDALSRFMQNTYDAVSRLTSVLHPGSLTTKQGFDNDSQLTSVTTPSDDTRTLQRDSTTQVTDETTADAISLQYQYNANDQLNSFSNGRGQSTMYQYDAASRLIQKHDTVSTLDYSYDANHNLTQVTENGITIQRQYDGFDRVIQYQEDTSQQRRIRYAFDKAGNLTNLVYPHTTDSASGFPVEYVYDALHQVTLVKSGSLALARYQYDPKGRITQMTRGNGSVLNLSYDAADRLISSIDKDASGNTIVEQHYQYDALGRLTQEITLPEHSPPDELVQPVTMRYGADNRLLAKDGTAFNFDGDGNITAAEGVALQFNTRNQLVQAGDINYQYNAEGHRIGRSNTKNDTVMRYLVSPHHLGLTQILRESDNLGINRDFIYGAQGLLAQFNRDDNQHYYFHYDYRGSVVAVTDDQGQVVARYGYMPFGKQYTISGSFETPFGYNGRDGVITDPNGLIYMRARYYSPDQRRFVSKDPLRGEISDLASLNRYAYVGGDPMNAVDPSGLCAMSFAGSLVNGRHCENSFTGNNISLSDIKSGIMAAETTINVLDINKKDIESVGTIKKSIPIVGDLIDAYEIHERVKNGEELPDAILMEVFPKVVCSPVYLCTMGVAGPICEYGVEKFIDEVAPKLANEYIKYNKEIENKIINNQPYTIFGNTIY